MDIPAILVRMMEQLAPGGPVMMAVYGAAYFLALLLAWICMMQLKDAAENPHKDYKAPSYTFVAAAMMAAMPEAIATIRASTYGAVNSPLSYIQDGNPFGQSFRAVLTMVSCIGYFFFVRGVWAVKEAGEPQRNQNASMWKALCILGSAMAAIYIDFTIRVVADTIGWNVSRYLA